MARLLSVNVGMPADVGWNGAVVRTGIWKHPVDGPVMVRRMNVDGDGQADRGGHGGEMRAVLVYQIDSYRYWQEHFGRTDFSFGQFGENLTVEGLADDEVCIGDRYRIGEAEFEVTQPRVTCFRVGLRLGEPQMPSLLVSHHRPGFYMRVLREGHVRRDDEIERVARGPGEVDVAEADALLYLPNRSEARLRAALDIPALSPGWRGSFEELLARAEAAPQHGGTAEASGTVSAVGWSGFRALTVTAVVTETATVKSFYLADPEQRGLPTARPGQYLTVRVPEAGTPAPVRSYSLSAVAATDCYRISVKHERDGVASSYLHGCVEVGHQIEVAAPRGDFVLGDEPGPVVLGSAGIGITPVQAMLAHLAATSPDREIWWLHAARSPAERALAEETQTLLAALPHSHAAVFYSRAGNHALGPAERSGRIGETLIAELGLPVEASVYLCGPDSFMHTARAALVAAGLDEHRIHSELFGARTAFTPGIAGRAPVAPHPPTGPAGPGPEVTFARSGLSVPWNPHQPSLLDFAEACDVPTRFACRSGVCHSCVTSLLSGDISYQPAPLDPPNADEILICTAQPTTAVVLDL